MSTWTFDKEKYIQILGKQGAAAALTCLHDDLKQWEYQAFEGEQGYQPEMWKALDQARQFSQELWDMAAAKKST